MNQQTIMHQLGQAARKAASQLAAAPRVQKNQALQAMAVAIRQAEADILAANVKDIELAKQNNKPAAFVDRLLLTAERIRAMADGLDAIAQLDDPVGRILTEWDRPNGLHIKRVAVPLGVIGVIYEARPNVTADAAGLCLKSGNAVILRGGSDSFQSAEAILQCLKQGLNEAGLPEPCIQMLPSADRELVGELLKMDQYVDVIVPRGGPSLIQRISEQSRIPLFKHLQGLCHTYIHQQANADMAKDVVLNAKMRRPGICGATETVLIDRAIVDSHLPGIVDALADAQCEVRGEAQLQQIDKRIKLAQAEDWDTEYLEAIVSIKIVDNIDEAIKHIAEHGSQHTDSIITDDAQAAEQFLNQVDSAIVMHNASTQFADGGEFGMGSEIGISTGKLHARGPVGVEQLTTFKYQVQGSGQTRPK